MAELCHMRDLNECGCQGSCQQQIRISEPPLIRPTNRDVLALFAFCIVISVILGGTYHALQQAEHQHQMEARV